MHDAVISHPEKVLNKSGKEIGATLREMAEILYAEVIAGSDKLAIDV